MVYDKTILVFNIKAKQNHAMERGEEGLQEREWRQARGVGKGG